MSRCVLSLAEAVSRCDWETLCFPLPSVPSVLGSLSLSLCYTLSLLSGVYSLSLSLSLLWTLLFPSHTRHRCILTLTFSRKHKRKYPPFFSVSFFFFFNTPLHPVCHSSSCSSNLVTCQQWLAPGGPSLWKRRREITAIWRHTEDQSGPLMATIDFLRLPTWQPLWFKEPNSRCPSSVRTSVYLKISPPSVVMTFGWWHIFTAVMIQPTGDSISG